MERLYFDPSQPGSLGGKETFYRHAPKEFRNHRSRRSSSSTTVDPFSSWEAYTLHRPISTRKYKRDRTVVHAIDEQWQADLCDVSRLASKNRGVKFLLTIVDVFSRYAWVKPVKNKSGPIIAQAFREIFESQPKRVPLKIQTDKGKEFWNKDVRAVFDEHEVEHFSTDSPDVKAALVERFNRTFKNRLYRLLTHKKTDTYLPDLQTLVDSYNRTDHSSLGKHRTPESASKQENLQEVWQYQYADLLADSIAKRRKQPVKFRIGDTVRMTKNKVAFQKGYLPNWSEEVFRVARVIYRRPVVYSLIDLEGEPIRGVFYAPELQLVKGYDEEVLPLDVLRKKVNKKTGEREVLIHHRGYPKDSLKWIAEKDLIDTEEEQGEEEEAEEK
jgi:transposase InsO family protein